MKTIETPLTAIAGAIFAPVALPLVCAAILLYAALDLSGYFAGTSL